jgi:SAM-dependent methyltransferase
MLNTINKTAENLQDVYNKIAEHFSITRYKVWPSTANFLNSLDINSINVEIGCGNGRNLFYRKELNILGVDFCENFVKMVINNGGKAIEGKMQDKLFDENSFDNLLCIAVFHHLDNDKDRIKTLNNFKNIVKKNGRLLITLWAMEQEETSPVKFSKKEEMVPWTDRFSNKVYYRYYRIFEENDFEEYLKLVPELKIENKFYENGNWVYILFNDKN